MDSARSLVESRRATSLWLTLQYPGGISYRVVTNVTIALLTGYEHSVCHPACHPAWTAPDRCSGGVVFSKLSKLLNQEDALGAPCLQRFRDYSGATKLARCRFRFGLHQLEALLRADVCSPLARPRGARECCGQV
jgi:hypothetical protein